MTALRRTIPHLSVPLVAAIIAVLLGVTVAAPAADAGPRFADAGPRFADAGTATITPGVQMVTDGAQCTANFVFENGATVYLGYAAHCAGTGAATDTNGCDAGSLPLGTPVEIDGATRPGSLAYSSWLAMQQDLAQGIAVSDDACDYNDFALVRIDPADVSRVNPSVPHWGGPTGLNSPSAGDGTAPGSDVYSYGNSGLRLGLRALSPKQGVSLGTTGSGWTHPVYTVTPGIPGDSGSAMLDEAGRAAGVLSTVAIAPLTGSNNFGDLFHELSYMRSSVAALAGVALVEGTVAFDPDALPVGL